MVDRLYAVYGASGFGREIMPVMRQQFAGRFGLNEFVFVDDDCNEVEANGHKIISYEEFLAFSASGKYVSIAISNSKVREGLEKKCESDGIEFVTVHPANTVFTDGVDLTPGAIINQYVVLSSNIKVGRQFHINSYSYIGHDCIIGDYVTFAPAVKCNGNVVIEDHAYIGTGAILRQGTSEKPLIVGCGAVVGMGAVVTKDVPAGVTVVGNPAKVMVRGGGGAGQAPAGVKKMGS
jgi:sugar O-acyltransferase (sialic acid O-acetyltransferase NeuD family)